MEITSVDVIIASATLAAMFFYLLREHLKQRLKKNLTKEDGRRVRLTSRLGQNFRNEKLYRSFLFKLKPSEYVALYLDLLSDFDHETLDVVECEEAKVCALVKRSKGTVMAVTYCRDQLAQESTAFKAFCKQCKRMGAETAVVLIIGTDYEAKVVNSLEGVQVTFLSADDMYKVAKLCDKRRNFKLKDVGAV